MNKIELIAAVAKKAGMPKRDAEAAVNAIVDIVTESLHRGENVKLPGFGSFEVRTRAAWVNHDPRTKEPIHIAASKHPAFKAGKTLKKIVAH